MLETLPEGTRFDGAVIYCDGSAKSRPGYMGQGSNPGFLGFGFHGYVYNKETPKKGCGNNKVTLTTGGYVEKTKEEGKAVTPLYYFDGMGGSDLVGSNNTAEILAAQAAIEAVHNWPLNRLLLKSDSRYVVQGLNDWSQSWVQNRWIRKDGSEVPNKIVWQSLLSNLAQLKDKGVSFEIQWLKGHSTHLGNNLADKLADIGSEISKGGQSKTIVTATKAEGYWKPLEERHALLAHRSMFFSTLGRSFIPGEYYLGNASKSDEFIGKRESDGAYAVVQLDKPEPVLEMIRKRQIQFTQDIDTLVLARIDRIFTGSKADDLIRYGEHCLLLGKRTDGTDLFFVTDRSSDEEPITEQLYPPMIALRTMECISELKDILNTFKLAQTPGSVYPDEWSVHEITDKLYETKTKKQGKTETQVQDLKPEISSLLPKLALSLEAHGRSLEFDLIFGTDILHRNNLKRLSVLGVKVWVVIVKEGETAFRFHSVIQAGETWSIWSGYYTNLILLPPAK